MHYTQLVYIDPISARNKILGGGAPTVVPRIVLDQCKSAIGGGTLAIHSVGLS